MPFVTFTSHLQRTIVRYATEHENNTLLMQRSRHVAIDNAP